MNAIIPINWRNTINTSTSYTFGLFFSVVLPRFFILLIVSAGAQSSVKNSIKIVLV